MFISMGVEDILKDKDEYFQWRLIDKMWLSKYQNEEN